MDFKSQTIPQLEKTIAEAQAVLDEKKAARRAELMAELQSLGKPVKVSGKSLKVKYRGPNGETYSGRGALPAWAVKLGLTRETIEQYRVK